MPAPKFHFFICGNQRPPGHPKGSCAGLGAFDVIDAFMQQLEAKNLWGTMKVTPTGCMGPCMAGSIAVCYPEGIWYQGIKPEDVTEIIESHVIGGKPVERLMLDPAMLG